MMAIHPTRLEIFSQCKCSLSFLFFFEEARDRYYSMMHINFQTLSRYSIGAVIKVFCNVIHFHQIDIFKI